jgi:type IV fimbrial biogenesis protein FimU
MKNSNITPLYCGRQKGLTLIELMVTTIILGILASAAVPAMKALFERKHVPAIGDFFVKSIKLARIEAIQRGLPVRVMPTSGNGNWSLGWNIQYTLDDGSIKIIRTFPALSGGAYFFSADFDADDDLIILPTGQVETVGEFDLYYPGCVGEKRHNFNLLLSGLMKRRVATCPT